MVNNVPMQGDIIKINLELQPRPQGEGSPLDTLPFTQNIGQAQSFC